MKNVIFVLKGGGFIPTKMEDDDALQVTQDFAKFKQGVLPRWPQQPVIAGETFTVVTDEVQGVYCSDPKPLEGEEWKQ